MDPAVQDESAASSPATAEAEQQQSLEQRAYALTGKAREHWMLTGDVDAAEALNTDVAAAPSPAPVPPVETDEGETGPDSGTAPSKQPKKTQTENFAELRKKAIAAEARADLLERQLAESRKSAPAAEPEVQPKPAVQSNGKPRLSDYTAKIGETFQTFEEAQEAYDDARDEYRFHVEQSRQSHKQTADSWTAQVEASKAKYSDFEAVAFSAETPASDVMVRAIQGRKDGAEIAYYLGKHPEVAKALTARTEANPADLRSLGRAEALAEVEFDRIAESFKKPAVNRQTARQPKPTSEVSVEPRGSAVDDEEADAINRDDVAAYMRIANARDVAKFRSG